MDLIQAVKLAQEGNKEAFDFLYQLSSLLFVYSYLFSSYNKFVSNKNLLTDLFFFYGIEVRTSKRSSPHPIPIYTVNNYIY